jgi:hypothetical protein
MDSGQIDLFRERERESSVSALWTSEGVKKNISEAVDDGLPF